MTKADLAQKHERDHAEWQRRGITGVVTALNPATKEITVTTRGREQQDRRHRRLRGTASGATRRIRFVLRMPSRKLVHRIATRRHGASARRKERGRNPAQSRGNRVRRSFQTIAGTVVSVDPAAGEVRLTDLQTKKPLTIRINPNSQLRRLEERTAMMVAGFMRPADPAAAGAAPQAGGPPPAAQEAGGEGRGGRGGFGGRGRGNFDLQQILDRSPQLALADLKKGDAIILSSAKAADGSVVTAISIVAGVEPVLASAPRTAGQVNLGSWNLEAGMPEQ